MGTRKRYRLIDIDELLLSLSIGGIEEFREWYLNTLNDKLKSIGKRESYWSEAVAIGDDEYLKAAAHQAEMKRYTIKEARPEVSYLMGKSVFS